MEMPCTQRCCKLLIDRQVRMRHSQNRIAGARQCRLCARTNFPAAQLRRSVRSSLSVVQRQLDPLKLSQTSILTSIGITSSAAMSPRRSSRARPLPTAANGGGSSSSSTRNDRPGRGAVRVNSNLASPLSGSDSDSDGAGDRKASQSEIRRSRSSRRQVDEIANEGSVNADDAEDDNGDVDADGDEEEITRCICRRQDFPGLPQLDASKTNAYPWGDDLPDDAGSLFIQCDTCKVWQHGGCVGIMSEAQNPDNYFCEQCRPELHKIKAATRG
ncbi:hypothetical protein MRB53_037622 [Persea americana]|nr:hypothetical protein MRB53_037622 [Persea americana]